MAKQKSIFDKVQVKVPQKEKTKEEFIPFEESIFAKRKKSTAVPIIVPVEDTIFCQKSNDEYIPIEDTIFCQSGIYKDNDNEDNKTNEYIVHDDEVPLEESIFARNKKKPSFTLKANSKDDKIDLEEVFNRYKVIYTNEYILNIKRLNMIDVDTFNNCCVLLDESRKTKFVNVQSYDIVKQIIKSVCTCVADTFYSYTNMNTALINLISELDTNIDVYTMYHVIDRSYSEAIEEFGGINGKDCQKH